MHQTKLIFLFPIDVTFLVLFMISTIFYYVLILGLSNFKRWLVAIWMSVGLIEICLTVGEYARTPLQRVPWVQLHPLIFRNGYLHPSIFIKNLIVIIIFDNLWGQTSFSSHICTHGFKILKRALLPVETFPSKLDSISSRI